MAKVAFGKLQLTKNTEVKAFEFAGQNVEVKQYLPIDEKTQMFERIISASADNNGYYNVTKVNFWMDLEIVFTYTNISFTDKQKEDLFKLYDLMKGNGFIQMVKDNMREEELAEIIQTVWTTIENIYKHASSALGVMQAIATDYSDLNLEAAGIQEQLADPENLTLLKNVLTKLG